MLAYCPSASTLSIHRSEPPYISKLSFQYGFRVFLMTVVVRVCSPDMVATAKGSGNPVPVSRKFYVEGWQSLTEDIAFV